MKKLSEEVSDNAACSPVLLSGYKILKKIGKYSFYFAIAYFAIEGFMAWE